MEMHRFPLYFRAYSLAECVTKVNDVVPLMANRCPLRLPMFSQRDRGHGRKIAPSGCSAKAHHRRHTVGQLGAFGEIAAFRAHSSSAHTPLSVGFLARLAVVLNAAAGFPNSARFISRAISALPYGLRWSVSNGATCR